MYCTMGAGWTIIWHVKQSMFASRGGNLRITARQLVIQTPGSLNEAFCEVERDRPDISISVVDVVKLRDL